MAQALAEQEKVNQGVELFVRHGIFQCGEYAFSLEGLDCGRCRAPFKPLTAQAEKEIRQGMEILTAAYRHKPHLWYYRPVASLHMAAS